MKVALGARVLPRLKQDEVAELMRMPPGVRGFWTDEELLRDAGLSSLPMLKKLQALGWVRPDHTPIAGGGRRRAWVLREVMRAALVVGLAHRTELAVQAMAMLLGRAPFEWLEGAAELDRRIAAVGGHRAEGDPPLHPSRFCIIEMAEAWIEREPGEFELVSAGMALSGKDLLVPANRELRRQRKPEHAILASAAVVLTLDLAKVPLSVVAAATQDRLVFSRRIDRP